MGLADVTESAPVRRMSVVRGTVAPMARDAAAEAGAEAAAVLAAKGAAAALPDVHPVALTHVDVLWQENGEAGDAAAGARVSCTVTVRAHARQDLDSVAMHAVCTALVALRAAAGDPAARITDVELVQNVE